jgi:hypothetical protein
MVNNFAQIREYMTFNSPDEFYFLQILQRKKDGPGPDGVQITGTNNKSRAIKSYCVTSKEYLDKIEFEVKHLCDFFNARAMMYVAKRSFKQVALKNLVLAADNIEKGNYEHTKTNYWSACGKCNMERIWLIDVDEEDVPYLQHIKDIICSEDMHSGFAPNERIIMEVPTKHGFHLICRPFDTSHLLELYPKPGREFVHKDNPTCLYIP